MTDTTREHPAPAGPSATSAPPEESNPVHPDPHLDGGGPPAPSDAAVPRASRGARIGTAVAAFVVVIYVAMSVLMVVPQNPTTQALTASARPYFTQQWNVFAPTIQKTDRYLEMQAQWRDASGALVKSQWIGITQAEYRAGEEQFQASRTNKQSNSLLKAYTARFQLLTPEQKTVVQDTFIRRTDAGFAAKDPSALVTQLTDLDAGSRPQVISLLRADYVLKEFTTYWSTAYFGKDIERVRWRVAASRPNDYEHRLDPEQQFTPSVLVFGWRQVDDVIDPQALSVFQSVVERYAR